MPEYIRVQAIVDLDAIANNVREVKKHLGGSKLMAVVKADGYGHGAAEVSKTMLYNGADALAVAICEEGVSLRENNIHVPVLILGYTPDALFDEVVKRGLTQTIFHKNMAKDLSEAAKKQNTQALAHIKIDTGMSRLGFMPVSSTVNEIIDIMNLDNIKVEGIYTHFATSDEKNSSFIYEQLERFNYLLSELAKKGVKIKYVHAANSGAVVNYPDISFNIARTGIILYGLPPANFLSLGGLHIMPAMSLKSKISYIKNVDENISIGYGRSFFTKRESRIATVPVGYADGYPRTLSNKAQVIVGGALAPVVGNICMDQMMIDVTKIENVNEADDVILLGSDNGCTITADSLAGTIGTINYEIVCNIGKRVPRAYTKNGITIKEINHILR